jgi:plastocyanin
MKTARTIWLVAALAVGLAAVASSAKSVAASPNDQPATGAEVKIDNFSFLPATITVPVGTTVRWTNRDDIPHTVVSDDHAFKSKALDTDDQFTYTFTKPGTYNYFCSVHPKMTATVVVQGVN